MHLSILTSVLLAATALAAPTVPSAGDALANSDDQIVTRAIYGGVASPGPEPVARRGDEDNTLARAFENANYGGAYWYIPWTKMGVGPSGGKCWSFPNKISSLSFISYEDKVKNNRFSCSWHYSNNCAGDGREINLDINDLHVFHLGDQFNSGKCWWIPHMKATTADASADVSDSSMASTNTSFENTPVEAAPAGGVVKRQDPNNSTDLVPIDHLDPTESIVVSAWEDPNWQGGRLGYLQRWQRTGQCAGVPDGFKMSSIMFYGDRNQGQCVGYTNQICQGTDRPNTELGIITNFRNLADVGFDDVIRSIKCFFTGPKPAPETDPAL